MPRGNIIGPHSDATALHVSRFSSSIARPNRKQPRHSTSVSRRTRRRGFIVRPTTELCPTHDVTHAEEGPGLSQPFGGPSVSGLSAKSDRAHQDEERMTQPDNHVTADATGHGHWTRLVHGGAPCGGRANPQGTRETRI